MPFVSLIIPVYKVEKYLSQCIDSVLSQGIEDIEIILVDDGSPDNCPQICEEYAKKETRIKVVHKENGGLSSARNAGIKVAQGEYAMFMDSDDWWNPEVCVKEIFSYVREHPTTEMFLLTALDFVDGQGLFKRKEHSNLESINTKDVESYYQALLDNGNMEVSACTKIFKTSFLKANNLYFKEGIKGEDNEWIIRVLRVLQIVQVISQPIYICRMGRSGSITNSIGISNILDLLHIVNESIFYYRKNDCNKTIKEKELCFCSYLWFSALGLSYKLSKNDKKIIKEKFKETASICQYANSRKTKLCYFVYRCFGLKITTFVLGKYIQRKNKKPINKIKVTIK